MNHLVIDGGDKKCRTPMATEFIKSAQRRQKIKKCNRRRAYYAVVPLPEACCLSNATSSRRRAYYAVVPLPKACCLSNATRRRAYYAVVQCCLSNATMPTWSAASATCNAVSPCRVGIEGSAPSAFRCHLWSQTVRGGTPERCAIGHACSRQPQATV
jgi:hypothetical protein